VNPDAPIVKHTYIWLDLIRALAALEVFLQHLRTLVFKNYWDGQAGITKKIFYFITGFSHEAVIIFFVLSGFLITGAIVKSREAGKFTALNYGLDRLVRLWIVLIPGLILTFCVDSMGVHWFGTTPVYLGTLNYMGNIAVASFLNWKTFFGNIFFLQTISVNTFGSNTALWSLGNEFWYYVLFPLIYFIFYSKNIWTRVLLLVVALGTFVFIGKYVAVYFLIWLIGSVLFFVKKRFRAPSPRLKKALLTGGLIAFIICLYKLRMSGSQDWAKDFVTGTVTSVLCYVGIYSTIRSRIVSKIISFFSGFSYSLYVIHLPLALFISSLLVGTQKDWGLSSFFLYLFIVVVILGLTILFWYCFESRYIRVRAYIKKRVFSKSAAALITN
jgi:peptidoglycan/LPS O-acetylase OafA/YrhL